MIQFHNKHLRPKSDGICVANHTTPIDVVVLSCDRSYALVIILKKKGSLYLQYSGHYSGYANITYYWESYNGVVIVNVHDFMD